MEYESMLREPAAKIEAWWFAASDRLPHGDGRKIEVGKAHTLRGPIILCEHALHASRDPFDALQYAPGPYLYRVLCSGDVQDENDKLGCRQREYVAMRDATAMLRQFAREQALSVIHLWDAPAVVREYLETGDESLREAARAAREAARAARAAAWEAREAAREAARAAREAAREAAWAAAKEAARVAAWAAGAAGAARAAREAAGAARNRFNELVVELFAGAEA